MRLSFWCCVFFIGEDDLLTFREKLLQRGNQLRVFGRNGVSYGLFVNAKPWPGAYSLPARTLPEPATE